LQKKVIPESFAKSWSKAKNQKKTKKIYDNLYFTKQTSVNKKKTKKNKQTKRTTI